MRRDLLSLRDLTVAHLPWLARIRAAVVAAVTSLKFPSPHHLSPAGGDAATPPTVSVDPDELKLYFHYQPTYYHLHVHVVHAALEAGATQAVGKAVAVDSVVAQLEGMRAAWDRGKRSGRRGEEGSSGGIVEEDDLPGMADLSMTYTLGEKSALWKEVFLPLREGKLE